MPLEDTHPIVPTKDQAPIKPVTQEKYLRTVKTAIKHSISIRTTDWEQPALVSMTQVVQDHIARTDLLPSTKNTLKAALIWHIESQRDVDNEDAKSALVLLRAMSMPRGPKPKSKSPKSIPEEDLSKLIDGIYARMGRSIWAQRTATWIFSALASGARPIEWLNAEWTDESRTILRIKNAKVKLSAPAFLRTQNPEADDQLDNIGYWSTNEDDTYREVPISKESDRSMISTQLDLVEEAAPRTMSEEGRRAEFKKYFDGCRLFLNRTCRTIWKGQRSYSLYTFRKQFSANMRASVGSDRAATLMGHSSADSPSAAYYGKANQAFGKFKTSRGPQGEGQANTDNHAESDLNGTSQASVE